MESPDWKINFQSLPVELIITILHWSSWSDVLRVRRTCRTLASVSREAPIWRGFIERYLDDEFVLTGHRLERRITDYHSDELENMFLGWIKTKYAMNDKDTVPKQVKLPFGYIIEGPRPDPTKYKKVRATCLVPGGRWLLVALNETQISYFDLHNLTRPQQELIPLRTFSEAYPDLSITLTIDVDATTDLLEFNLAVSFHRYKDDRWPNTRIAFVEIWRVTLNDDLTSLSTRKITTIPVAREAGFQVEQYSLRGSLLGYLSPLTFSLLQRTTQPGAAVVVDWKSVESSIYEGLVYDEPETPRLPMHLIFPQSTVMSDQESYLMILPGERIFICSSQHLALYYIAEVAAVLEPTPSMMLHPDAYKPSPCLWSLDIDDSLARCALSSVFHSQTLGLSRIIVYGLEGRVSAVDIPDALVEGKVDQVQVTNLEGRKFQYNYYNENNSPLVVGQNFTLRRSSGVAQFVSYYYPGQLPDYYSKTHKDVLNWRSIDFSSLLKVPPELEEMYGLLIIDNIVVKFSR